MLFHCSYLSVLTLRSALPQTISKAINQYCATVEEMFMAEMFPRPTDYLQPQKSSAWLEKAKQLAERNEKKIEPFTFQGESCVKLNNIEAARRLLELCAPDPGRAPGRAHGPTVRPARSGSLPLFR